MADKVHGLDINGDQWDIQDLPLTEQVALLQNEVDQLKQAVDYSEIEHLTGRKWIDGKPTYEVSTIVHMTQAGSIAKNLGVSNIDRVIKIESCMNYSNGPDYAPVPRYYSNSYWASVHVNKNTGSLVIESASWWGDTAVTIEYTKTTD